MVSDIYDIFTVLASEPLILESHRQRYVQMYLNEVMQMIPYIKQKFNADLRLPAPEYALTHFKKQDFASLVHPNALKRSNFDYLKSAITTNCSECSKSFQLTNKLDMCVCLNCGEYLHYKCAHSCNQLLYSVYNNQIVTKQFTINGYYKNQFREVQNSVIGPELFLDEEVLSQILIYIVLGEAVLQRDKAWVCESGQEEEENRDMFELEFQEEEQNLEEQYWEEENYEEDNEDY